MVEPPVAVADPVMGMVLPEGAKPLVRVMGPMVMRPAEALPKVVLALIPARVVPTKLQVKAIRVKRATLVAGVMTRKTCHRAAVRPKHTPRFSRNQSGPTGAWPFRAVH